MNYRKLILEGDDIMGVIKYQKYDLRKLEKDNPTQNLLSYNCPQCIDNEGNFGEIVLYVPQTDKYEVATQATCSGQKDKCTLMLTLMQTYNSEKLLKKLCDKELIK